MLESLNTDIFEYKKLSPEEMKSRGILGRLVGIMADSKKPTRNGRSYSDKLWENVFQNPIMKERIENNCCFGELGHPADREETDMEKIALCMDGFPKKDKNGKLQAVFNILDTPNGRILKTLCDYGCNIGISSRGSGDLISDYDGNESVDPDTYNCEGWDAVIIPAVKEARLQYVTESLDKTRYKKSLRNKLQESLDKASADDRKVMEEALSNIGFNLDEDIVQNGNKFICTMNGETQEFNSLENARKWQKMMESSITEEQVGREEVKQDKTPSSALNPESDSAPIIIQTEPDDELTESISSSTYVCQLPTSVQNEIKADITTYLTKEGYVGQELEDIVKTAMDGKLVDLSDDIDIHKYLKEEKYTRNELFDKFGTDNLDIINAGNEEDVELAAEDDGALIEQLQNLIKRNKSLEEDMNLMQEKLSVSYAKEIELKEEIDNYKKQLSKMSEKTKEISVLKEKLSQTQDCVTQSNIRAKDKLSTLTESLSGKDKENSKLKEINLKLKESVDSNNTKINSLKEQLLKERNNIAAKDNSISELKESYETAQKELVQLKEQHSNKIKSQIAIIEKYKKIANDSVKRYVESQAIRLGVKPNEIMNRLPKSYTFKDIDSICEDLQEYKFNMTNLPFNTSSLNENLRISAKNIGNQGLIENNPCDEITSYDLKIAEALLK